MEATNPASDDRWFLRSVRSTRPLAPGEERELALALEAHRVAIARHVLGSSRGFAMLRELRTRLDARTLDVRDAFEAEADQRIEDARRDWLDRLGRIARLATDLDPAAPLSQPLLHELRGLRLHREIVERLMADLAADARTAKGARRVALAESLGIIDTTSREATIARARLVESHRRLVVALARRHMHRGLDLPDLVQEGTLGLLRAVDKFEIGHGVVFATYAGWWIRQTIGRAIGNQGRQIRLPAGVEEGLRLLHVHRRRISIRTGRRPTTEEIAADAGVPTTRIAELLEVEHTVAAPPVSIDAEDSGNETGPAIGDTLADPNTLSPEATALSVDLSLQVRRALRTLSPREQRILKLRYGFGRCVEHTLEEIGAELGLTRQRILQIANSAMKKIRESSFARPLRTFVE